MRATGLEATGGAALNVVIALYRTANGWIAFFPPGGTPAAADAATWGDAVPHMRALAAAIPQLDAHDAFAGASPSDCVPVAPKATSFALAASSSIPVAGEAVPPAQSWPLPSADTGDGDALARLRLDVGWSVWDAEAEGCDLQAQARAHR